ncbi:hypothetical protein N657DRAFT_168585 [Parathielavia appendiculata]|uniref:Protein kinase domain-containing protein n=1 Tax=Parathielavia appendiculata TaxID=2587402 RepID=A0AAN6YZL6_9PEZI|nr:hypothetical protein N657DRAFT_168585 [Parathielavia appendiculata]
MTRPKNNSVWSVRSMSGSARILAYQPFLVGAGRRHSRTPAVHTAPSASGPTQSTGTPAARDVQKWALQTAVAFQYIHSGRVKQVDIGTYNVLLDTADNAKLSDFAGSSLDGSEPTVAAGVHSTHPRLSTFKPSVRFELFALGSLLYEIRDDLPTFPRKGRSRS